MKKYILLLSVFITSFFSTAFTKNENNIHLAFINPINIQRHDEYISINVNDLKKKNPAFSEKSFVVLYEGEQVPYQLETGMNGEKFISMVIDFKPNQTRLYEIKFGDDVVKNNEVKPRTYAEIGMKTDYQVIDGKYSGGYFKPVNFVRVPSSHKDHDALFKYEGPGWESEKVGYRFYLDWRNSTDIFGKKVNDLVLKDVGINDLTSTDNDSYHSMLNWGMDIFKVGSSLGIGTIGMWNDGKVEKVSKTDSVNCEIYENGPLKSGVKAAYYGWHVGKKKYDLVSKYSITAGSRLTKHEVNIRGKAKNLVTGLAKYHDTRFLKSDNKKGWNYIALYGKQSLAGDSLGIAVLYNRKNFISNKEDNASYIVQLKLVNNNLTYYFCAAWEQELNGIKSEKEFVKYLNQLVVIMNNPIIVK